jgi:Tol biopolymer transport system component
VLHHREDGLFGLTETYDFETAFEQVTGTTHQQFYEDWRRDVNVYYNTVAGQLETLDSLRIDTVRTPGRYVRHIEFSPDTSRIAALVDLSPDRPDRRQYGMGQTASERTIVAEGAIEPAITWHPTGERIVFSRQTRAEHGSIVDDLFAVDADGGNARRLTYGRRTTAPTYGPQGKRLAFAATETGTANIHLLNPKTNKTTPVTDYSGNVQITGLEWHPSDDTLAFSRVAKDAGREIVLYDIGADASTYLTDPGTDDRRPVWSADGKQLAYTSLRDGVPNAFVYDLSSDGHRRVTNPLQGAHVLDWIPANSLIVGSSTESRVS